MSRLLLAKLKHVGQPGIRSLLIGRRSLNTKAEIPRCKVGDVIHGFKLEKVDYVKELNIRPYYLRHSATGAEHIHIHKDGDSNNVFSVSLRTTPKSSSGVAHILEHLALCGSKKYPVRDPFMKMLTRSLATFMNAMTGPDFTLYPFSTQNKRDFENLLRVYIDAVFFPRLRPVDFRQEGWRLEHEVPDRKDTPIVLRGVVYNEMKGVFSSSSTIYSRQLLNNLFPDTTYRYESGGDPEHIPSLSHEELKKFHQVHYHPSNAKFFTYGDIPLENHLKLIDETVLSKFSENPNARQQSTVQEQPQWTQPKTVSISCPPDPMSVCPEKQTTTSISYMIPVRNIDFKHMFALQLLSSLLIDGPNAPFHQSLIDSGLGSDYSPSTGLGSYTKQPYFSVGLQNLRIEDISNVHDIINKTFEDTAKHGFSNERIEALLHNIELNLKHIRGNFGLRLIMNMESVWNHDGDVIDYLKVNRFVEEFKKELAGDNQYWSKLINKYFLQNKHKLILTMTPDESYAEKQKERERSLLENKIEDLNDVERQKVLYEGMELMKLQDSKGDLTVLPCLEPSKDISRDLPCRTDLKFDSHLGVSIQLCQQPTNEVIYFRGITNIGNKLEEDGLIDYLPLFCDVATKLGAGSFDRHKLSQKIQLTTGGLGLSLMINPSLKEFDKYRTEVCFGSHCLRRNVPHMFELWRNVFENIHFHENKEYLYQLIRAAASDLSDGISHSGQSYAIKKAASRLSSLSMMDERLSGLQFIARMKDIASSENIDNIANKLQKISRVVLDPSNMKCAVNAEPDAIQSVTDALKNLIDKSKDAHNKVANDDIQITREEYASTDVEQMKFPFATHFVAKSLVTVPKLHKDYAKLVVMSKLVSSKYLLKEVREKGGAYGSGARLSTSGILNFFSYRDPNTDKTLETYERSADWLIQANEYGNEEIEESKLGVFQDVDRPVEPGQRGMSYFTCGETDDMREDFRRRLLDVTKDDVAKVAKKYLKQKNFGSFIL